jgi:hypothetical protein
MAELDNSGVQFPHHEGSSPSASGLVRRLIGQAVRQFPQTFGKLETGFTNPFFRSAHLAKVLMDFEVLRGVSEQRVEVANYITNLVQESFLFGLQHGTQTLGEALAASAPPLPLTSEGPGSNYQEREIEISHKGQRFRGRDELLEAIARFVRDGVMSEEAGRALDWSINFVTDSDHKDQLRGRKFVLLGGTAELSPLSNLLSSGADVLTTHSSPESLHRKLTSELGNSAYPGHLFHITNGSDLLISPDSFSQTIVDSFAKGEKLDVGLFAYKGGGGREWRLAAVMDGIVRKLQRLGLLRSVIYYLSPSMITEISSSTAALSRKRFDQQYSMDKRLLNPLTLNSLWKGNVLEGRGKFWTRSVLPYQGASYAAANLFGKIYPAEVYCPSFEPGQAVIVSANVAPITATASTETAATRIAFAQAGHFGIDIFSPSTSRTLMYLLMLHDMLHPPPSCGQLFSKQLHGGVFTAPWALDSTLKLAYLRGILKRR